jgi:hypothetical protein
MDLIGKTLCIHLYKFLCYSENEFQVRLTEAITKWHNEEPGFAEYFLNQCNTEDSFNCWKIFCSAPGVAATNNALESFNKSIKKNFTLGTCHSLPALFDIIMERLLLNLSLDIEMERKIFEERCNPGVAVDEFDPFAKDFDRVPGAALVWTFLKVPLC